MAWKGKPNPAMTTLEARFLSILSHHRGMSHAISVPAMAQALGLGEGKSGQRRAQQIKRSLIEQGQMVGSSCGKVAGWYVPEDEAEIRLTLRQYQGRFTSLGVLLKYTHRQLRQYEAPQLGMF